MTDTVTSQNIVLHGTLCIALHDRTQLELQIESDQDLKEVLSCHLLGVTEGPRGTILALSGTLAEVRTEHLPIMSGNITL
jgi:hypothetical protein